MLQVGPDNTLFSKEAKITVQQAEAFVTALNEKLLPSDQTQHLFSDFKARFDELKRELNNSLNELNANLVQLRNDLWDSLVSAYGGRVPRKWPRVDASAAESQFEFMDNTRDLMFMLMGLSLGRLFRAKLPPELQTLPESMSLDIFKAKVFEFAVAVPFEELYCGLVAQSLMSELVIRTVMKEQMVFDLSRNFTWNEREKKGNAVYSFQDDLQRWPFSLVANSGVKFGKLPVKLPEPGSAGPICESCMRTNAEEVGMSFRPDFDLVRSLAFKDEILHKNTQPLALLTFVSQSRADMYHFRRLTPSALSHEEQEVLQRATPQASAEEEEEALESKDDTKAAAIESLKREYVGEYDRYVTSPKAKLTAALLISQAYDSFLINDYDEVTNKLFFADDPEATELNSSFTKFKDHQLEEDEMNARFESALRNLLESEDAIRSLGEASSLVHVYVYLKKPIQLQVTNAKAADQFLDIFRGMLNRGEQLPFPASWTSLEDSRCPQPKEKLMVWVFLHLILLALQELQHPDNNRKQILFERFMKLKAAGYIDVTRSLSIFQDVDSIDMLFEKISEVKGTFLFAPGDQICFTQE